MLQPVLELWLYAIGTGPIRRGVVFVLVAGREGGGSVGCLQDGDQREKVQVVSCVEGAVGAISRGVFAC